MEVEGLVASPSVDHDFALIVTVFEGWAGADLVTLPFDLADSSATCMTDLVGDFNELEDIFLYGR